MEIDRIDGRPKHLVLYYINAGTEVVRQGVRAIRLRVAMVTQIIRSWVSQAVFVVDCSEEERLQTGHYMLKLKKKITEFKPSSKCCKLSVTNLSQFLLQAEIPNEGIPLRIVVPKQMARIPIETFPTI